MNISLSDDATKQSVASIERYFAEELDQDAPTYLRDRVAAVTRTPPAPIAHPIDPTDSPHRAPPTP